MKIPLRQFDGFFNSRILARGFFFNKALRSAFTLIELLVVLAIVSMFVAISMPMLHRMRTSVVQTQFRAAVLAAMQSNITLVNTYKNADADNSDPRIVGGTYGGTALIFDKEHALVRFYNNNQAATDTAFTDVSNPNHWIEQQTFVQASTGQIFYKKAYDALKPIEPLRIVSSVGVVGVVRDDKGTADPVDDELKMVPMPFAVCCNPDSYGLPVAPMLYADLAGDGHYKAIATALPCVIVFMKSNLESLGFDPEDLNTLPGATDQQKINLLLGQKPGHGGGLLIDLTLQNGAAVDTP